MCFLDLTSTPLRGCPVKRLAMNNSLASLLSKNQRWNSHPTLFDNIIKGAYDFLHRYCKSVTLCLFFLIINWSKHTTVVVSVREDNINVVKSKTSQWFLGAFNNAKIIIIFSLYQQMMMEIWKLVLPPPTYCFRESPPSLGPDRGPQ